MSDLAPFIATAMRNKFIANLKKENDRLQKELHKSRVIEITGPKGDPIYAHAQFGNNEKYASNTNLWCVSFQQLRQCPLSELPGVEFRVEVVMG